MYSYTYTHIHRIYTLLFVGICFFNRVNWKRWLSEEEIKARDQNMYSIPNGGREGGKCVCEKERERVRNS